MSSDVQFAAGDHVVYPAHGVGEVIGMENREVSGYKIEVVVIRFERDRMRLSVPTTKTRISGLRHLSSLSVMGKVFDVLRTPVRVRRAMWSRRAQEYGTKINSGNPLLIAEVVRDLRRSPRQSDQSFSERQILNSAEDRLARELALIEMIDETTALQRIHQVIAEVIKATKARAAEAAKAKLVEAAKTKATKARAAETAKAKLVEAAKTKIAKVA